jgi:hypothetical protein
MVKAALEKGSAMRFSNKINTLLILGLTMSSGSCQEKDKQDYDRKNAQATTTAPPPGTGGGNVAAPTGGVDKDGIKRIYAATGKEVELEYGARHENGDRYNVNHKFLSYEVTGYYKVSNTEKIEMKTDGPNHGGCEELPKCMWAEPQFEIKGGKAAVGAEYPHPKNHNDIECSSCKALGTDFTNKWIGYKVIAYTNKEGYRVYEQWVDPEGLDASGKPANKWVNVMKEVDKGQIVKDSKGRKLPIEGKGLESEIRCHGGHDTELKFGKVEEITPPAE